MSNQTMREGRLTQRPVEEKKMSSCMSIGELLRACSCIDGGDGDGEGGGGSGSGRHWHRGSHQPPPAPPPSRVNSSSNSRAAMPPRPKRPSQYQLDELQRLQESTRRDGGQSMPRPHSSLPRRSVPQRHLRPNRPVVMDSPTARIVEPEREPELRKAADSSSSYGASATAEQQRRVKAEIRDEQNQDKLHLEKIRRAQRHGKGPEVTKDVPAIPGDNSALHQSALLDASPRARQPTVPDRRFSGTRGTGMEDTATPSPPPRTTPPNESQRSRRRLEAAQKQADATAAVRGSVAGKTAGAGKPVQPSREMSGSARKKPTPRVDRRQSG